jgi:hypothetical protein
MYIFWTIQKENGPRRSASDSDADPSSNSNPRYQSTSSSNQQEQVKIKISICENWHFVFHIWEMNECPFLLANRIGSHGTVLAFGWTGHFDFEMRHGASESQSPSENAITMPTLFYCISSAEAEWNQSRAV